MGFANTAKIQHDTLILAGGRASRLGGDDKGLVTLGGIPLIEHSIRRLNPNNTHIIISANRNLSTYRRYGHTVVKDKDGDFQGPLSGIRASLSYMQSNYLFICTCDTPFLPLQIESKLMQVAKETSTPACVLKHHDRIEPLIALIEKQQLQSIRAYLESGGRSVLAWLEQQNFALYESHASEMCFLNINSEKDLRIANNYLSENSRVQSTI